MPERGKTEWFSTFEESLLELEKECKEPVPIKKILTKLSGKGKTILLIVLCIPLGQIIGFSVFFGLLIAFLGFKMAFYKNAIWLPASLLKKKIPGNVLKKLIRNILFSLKKLRSVSRPRAPFFWKSKQMQRVNSFLIGTIGICLALSPPVPLTSYTLGSQVYLFFKHLEFQR